jgi:hypothetical protein
MIEKNVLSNEDFQQKLREYIAENRLGGPVGLARHLQRPQSTVGDWLYKGVLDDGRRARVIRELPQIFNHHEDSFVATGTLSGSVLARLKVELVQERVSILSGYLEWFLFQASELEREQLRNTLGEKWNHFLELTRAMTSERAFEMAQEEGRLYNEDGN